MNIFLSTPKKRKESIDEDASSHQSAPPVRTRTFTNLQMSGKNSGRELKEKIKFFEEEVVRKGDPELSSSPSTPPMVSANNHPILASGQRKWRSRYEEHLKAGLSQGSFSDSSNVLLAINNNYGHPELSSEPSSRKTEHTLEDQISKSLPSTSEALTPTLTSISASLPTPTPLSSITAIPAITTTTMAVAAPTETPMSTLTISTPTTTETLIVTPTTTTPAELPTETRLTETTITETPQAPGLDDKLAIISNIEHSGEITSNSNEPDMSANKLVSSNQESVELTPRNSVVTTLPSQPSPISASISEYCKVAVRDISVSLSQLQAEKEAMVWIV